MEASSVSHSLRIFVVENHLPTVRCLQLYLQSEGHSVRYATSVSAALETIPTAPCDVLISDMGLPDGDGWGLLLTLREKGIAPPFAIAISGYGAASDRAKSAEAGFRHHLLKPFDLEELDGILLGVSKQIVPGDAGETPSAGNG